MAQGMAGYSHDFKFQIKLSQFYSIAILHQCCQAPDAMLLSRRAYDLNIGELLSQCLYATGVIMVMMSDQNAV